MHARRLVRRIGKVATVIAGMHAVVVLEPHAVAELVQERGEQVVFLAKD